MIHKDYPSDVVESIPGVGDGKFFISVHQHADTFTVLYHKSFVTLLVRGSWDKNLKAGMIHVMTQALTKF
jgi:hypothetical protein